MPVFGADPDSETSIWEENTHFVRQYVSKPVSTLTSYFGYHPSMKMDQIFGDKDKTALNAYFSRKLKQGFTDRSLRSMVDRFWQSWGAETQRPAFTFLSTKVQQQLTLEAEIVKNDPVLGWLLNGMPNHGPFEDPASMRSNLLQHSVEGMFTYPEVVADIIRPDDDQHHLLLIELDNLIMWKLGMDGAPEYDSRYVSLLQVRASLPSELATERRCKIRPKADTVQQAIANIPLHKKLEW